MAAPDCDPGVPAIHVFIASKWEIASAGSCAPFLRRGHLGLVIEPRRGWPGHPDLSSGAAKTVELPRRTQGSFARCFCSPNPSASTSAPPIQMHYEPFCSGSKVQELNASK